jgi:hypothetical protein
LYKVGPSAPPKFRRVGPLRNLGASLARAPRLVFCDADFWLSPLLLQSFEKAALDENVWLQPIRQQNSKALAWIEGRHWRDFKGDDFSWMETKNPWMWGSSYCFSVPRASFLEIGGFCEAFRSYGLEDTELAYRWVKRGGSFQKLRLPVLHLERGWAVVLRKWVLKTLVLHRSAETFYRLYLDREIYRLLFPWMGSFPIFRKLLGMWSRLPAFFWKQPVDFVARLLKTRPTAVAQGIRSRSGWALAQGSHRLSERIRWRLRDWGWRLRAVRGLFQMSFYRSKFAKVGFFYAYHYKKNYEKLWGEAAADRSDPPNKSRPPDLEP